MKLIPVGFQEPRCHSVRADETLNVTTASQLQLSKWYDEPHAHLAFAEGMTLLQYERTFTEPERRLFARDLRRDIRRELKARQQAKQATRMIEHRGSKRVFLIGPNIEAFRRLINF